jgi:Uma2 family endonuclease
MDLRVGERSIHPLTAAQVLRMAEVGILDEDAPVELLDGVLTAVSPKSPEHEAVKERLLMWLAPAVAAARGTIRVVGCLMVPETTSLPEPDLMVLAPGQPPDRHPTTALLAVEVAVSSQPTDLGRKAELYAAADVGEYWVVDVPGRRVERFTEPGTGGFASRRTLVHPAVLSPLAFDVAPLELEVLFAGVGRS